MSSISGDLSTNLTSVWLTDSSGLTTDLHGSNDLTNDGVTLTTGTQGDAGDFELGEADKLTISDGSASGLEFGSSDFTIGLIFTPESQPATNTNMGLVSKSSADAGYFLDYRDDGGVKKIRFATGNGGGFDIMQINQTFSNATTYFIMVVKSGTSAEIFVNNSSIGSGTVTGTITGDTGAFTIGDSSGTGDPVDGVINQVIVWNGIALDSTARSTWYNSGSGISYAVSYTLEADSGSFTLSGQNLGLLANRSLSLVSGSFTLAGQDVGVLAGRVLVLESGSFSFAFQDSGLDFAGWGNTSKVSSVWSDTSKVSSTWVDDSKNSSSWTNDSK